MLTRLGLRTFATASIKVFNDVAKQQFRTSNNGAEATLDYAVSGQTINLITTNVPKEFQGKGVGNLLAEFAFDYAKKKEFNVVINCHFLEHYYTKNKAKYEGLKVTIDII